MTTEELVIQLARLGASGEVIALAVQAVEQAKAETAQIERSEQDRRQRQREKKREQRKLAKAKLSGDCPGTVQGQNGNCPETVQGQNGDCPGTVPGLSRDKAGTAPPSPPLSSPQTPLLNPPYNPPAAAASSQETPRTHAHEGQAGPAAAPQSSLLALDDKELLRQEMHRAGLSRDQQAQVFDTLEARLRAGHVQNVLGYGRSLIRSAQAGSLNAGPGQQASLPAPAETPQERYARYKADLDKALGRTDFNGPKMAAALFAKQMEKLEAVKKERSEKPPN